MIGEKCSQLAVFVEKEAITGKVSVDENTVSFHIIFKTLSAEYGKFVFLIYSEFIQLAEDRLRRFI